MTAPAISLTTLAQNIAQQQEELERLRREYEARQTRVAALTRRKEELQSQLHQVDRELEAVSQGRTNGAAADTAPASPAKARASTTAAAAPKQTLPELITVILNQATGPRTIKQLTEEVQQRGFRTQSKHLEEMVGARVGELVKKSLLQRSKDETGHILVRATQGKGVAGAKVPRPTGTSAEKLATSAKSRVPAKAKARKGQPSLRVLLTELLRKSKQPVGGSELAKRALDSGYRSNSADFAGVVWVMLGKMDNVENVKGKGYRLKKR